MENKTVDYYTNYLILSLTYKKSCCENMSYAHKIEHNCPKIINAMMILLQQNSMESYIADLFIDYLNKSKRYCMYLGTNHNLINLIIKSGIILSDDSVKIIINRYMYKVIRQLINNKFKFNNEHIELILIMRLDSLLVNILKYTNIDEQYLDKIIELKLENVARMVVQKLNKIWPTEFLLKCIQSHMFNLAKDLISKSIELNEQCFVSACAMKSIELVQIFLDNNFCPTNECISELLKNIRKYPTKNKSKGVKKIFTNIQATLIVNLLVEYGYALNYNDLLKLMEYGIVIKDYEKFNFEFDEKYLLLSTKLNFYPYKTFLKPTKKVLELACGHFDNLSKIKEIIKFGIEPTNLCLEKACGVKSNTLVIKLLLSKSLKLTPKCVENLKKTYPRDIDDYICKLTDGLIKTASEIVPLPKKEKKEKQITSSKLDNNLNNLNDPNNLDNVDDLDNVDNLDNVDDLDEEIIVVKPKKHRKKKIDALNNL
jgi:hypothetical protein